MKGFREWKFVATVSGRAGVQAGEGRLFFGSDTGRRAGGRCVIMKAVDRAIGFCRCNFGVKVIWDHESQEKRPNGQTRDIKSGQTTLCIARTVPVGFCAAHGGEASDVKKRGPLQLDRAEVFTIPPLLVQTIPSGMKFCHTLSPPPSIARHAGLAFGLYLCFYYDFVLSAVWWLVRFPCC